MDQTVASEDQLYIGGEWRRGRGAEITSNFPAVGSLKWLRGPEAPFAAWPIWAPLLLAGLGALMLFLAVLNMMHVRQMMRRSGAR